MFISYDEKKKINDTIKKLNDIVDKLTVESVMFSARIQALECKLYQIKEKKTRVRVTAEHRKQKQREYNKRYAEKKKQLAKEALNVSS
jgi:septal ring factor EnvC (AmiA/AmiB activator)